MINYLTSPTCWVLFWGSLFGALGLTPQVIRLARKFGALDRGGYRKINGHAIPLMGGLAIIIPLLGVCFLGILQPTAIFALLGAHYKDLALLAAGGVVIAATGIIDDIRGLRPKDKFVVQIFVALLVCLAGKTLVLVSLPIVGTVNLGAFGGMALTIFWIVGMINAFNLVDGVDGLATGLALVSAVGLGIVAALNGHTAVVLVCLGLAGSLIGFLFFNFHPAKIFLGDTGSLFLGYVLATLSLLGTSKASGAVMLLTPILALGFPIFDTITSMGRRVLRGRSPFVGDRSHTHHRLLDYGYTQRQVVLILYGVALMCTIAAVLCQILYPQDTAPIIAVGMYATIIMLVAWVNGYLRLRHAFRVSRCRSRNAKLESFGRFASLSLSTDSSLANLREILHIGCKELHLRFLDVGYDDDEENTSILSVNLKTDDNLDEPAFDPVELLRIQDAAGQHLLIRYQIDHRAEPEVQMDEEARENDKLEHQDVMACLAHLFSRIEVKVPPPDDAEELARLRKKVAVVHDIGNIDSNN